MFLVTCFQGFSDINQQYLSFNIYKTVLHSQHSLSCGKDGSEADSITVQKTKQTQDAIYP